MTIFWPLSQPTVIRLHLSLCKCMFWEINIENKFINLALKLHLYIVLVHKKRLLYTFKKSEFDRGWTIRWIWVVMQLLILIFDIIPQTACAFHLVFNSAYKVLMIARCMYGPFPLHVTPLASAIDMTNLAWVLNFWWVMSAVRYWRNTLIWNIKGLEVIKPRSRYLYIFHWGRMNEVRDDFVWTLSVAVAFSLTGVQVISDHLYGMFVQGTFLLAPYLQIMRYSIYRM